MRNAGFIALFLLTLGCGAEGKFGGEKDDKGADGATASGPQHSMLVDSAALLPGCDAAAEGWIVFVADEKALKACKAGAWAVVEMKPQPLKVIAAWHCGISDVVSEDENSAMIGESYLVTKFSDGSFLAQCYSITAFSGASDQASGVEIHTVESEAAKTGVITCLAGTIGMRMNIAEKKATYVDISAPSKNRTVSCEGTGS